MRFIVKYRQIVSGKNIIQSITFYNEEVAETFAETMKHFSEEVRFIVLNKGDLAFVD